MQKNKNPFLVVQGRTLPQIENNIQYFPLNWKDEFPLISNLGFDGIEWIYDVYSEQNNPILTDSGRKEIKKLSDSFNVSLENIVFDWFMFNPLLSKFSKQNFEKLEQLIYHSSDSGFKHIILPMMEKNEINSSEKLKEFISNFSLKILPILDKVDLQLHFETSLSPKNEVLLLNSLKHKKLKICYDMGNSASFGFHPSSTINLIEKYLGSVHVKDRVLNGPTTPLGEGCVDFKSVFETLFNVNFQGPISFQIYRNKYSDNIQILKESKKFIETCIKNQL